MTQPSTESHKKREKLRTKFVDRFIPAQALLQEPEMKRKSRLLALFHISLILFGSFYTLMYAGVYKLPVVAAIIGVAVCIACLLPKIWEWSGNQVLACYQLLASFFVVLFSIAHTTGGLESAALFWFASLPLLATILLNARHGFAWLGMSAASALYYYVTERYFVELESMLPQEAEATSKLVAIIGLCALTYLLAELSEAEKQHMLNEVESAKKDAENQKLTAIAAHENAKLVLDSVDQGLVVVDFEGRMQGATSRALRHWFGPPEENHDFSDYMLAVNEEQSNWISLVWRQLNSRIIPAELLLKQIPKQFQAAKHKHFQMECRVMVNSKNEPTDQVIVVITDVTQRVKAELAEESRRETLGLIEKLAKNRQFTNDLIEELASLVKELKEAPDKTVEKRTLHTLKGTSAVAGLDSISRLAHHLESRLQEARARLSRQQLRLLTGKWKEIREKIQPFLAIYHRDNVLLDGMQFMNIHSAVSREKPYSEILEILNDWRKEPLRDRFTLLGEHAKRVAVQLGKGEIRVHVEDNGISVVEKDWAHFWSNITHAVRNAIDHGIEWEEEREKAGKQGAGLLTLQAVHRNNELVIRIQDDGRGINWEGLREKAGIDKQVHMSEHELTELLFVDGLSINSDVSEISGRGIGMGALREACEELGGRLEIISEQNVGTTIECIFPIELAGSAAA